MKIIFLAVLLASMAHAKTDTCNFTLDCKVGKKQFSLEFKSKSNECTEDDMQVSYSSGDDKNALNIKPDWYFYTDNIARKLKSVCSAKGQSNPAAAYFVDGDKVILFQKSSGRPGFDRVNVILLDQQGKFLDQMVVGESKNAFLALLPHGKDFKLRIIRDSLSFHKEVTCDCDAPFVDDWLIVEVKKNKLSKHWLAH